MSRNISVWSVRMKLNAGSCRQIQAIGLLAAAVLTGPRLEADVVLETSTFGGGLRLRGVEIVGESITRVTLAQLTLPQEARIEG